MIVVPLGDFVFPFLEHQTICGGIDPQNVWTLLYGWSILMLDRSSAGIRNNGPNSPFVSSQCRISPKLFCLRTMMVGPAFARSRSCWTREHPSPCSPAYLPVVATNCETVLSGFAATFIARVPPNGVLFWLGRWKLACKGVFHGCLRQANTFIRPMFCRRGPSLTRPCTAIGVGKWVVKPW